MTETKVRKFVAPSWNELFWNTVKLAEMIEKDCYNPDIIVAIARGGWIIGRLLSDLLKQPNVANIRVQFYRDIGVTEKTPIITQPVSVDVKGLKVLLVDDVADTGESLKTAYEHLLELGAVEIRTATVYYKPWSKFKPDYYVVTTEAWIIFPHEIREAVEALYKRWKNEGLTLKEMLKILEEAGMDGTFAKYFLEKAVTNDYRRCSSNRSETARSNSS